MLAEPAAQVRLLDLQTLDTAIAQLEHRRASLPEHARVAALESQRQQLNAELVAAQTTVSDLEADQAKAEADLEPVRERLARDQKAVDGGAMDAKALVPMLDEIEHLKTRITVLEDEELEIMEALEGARARLEVIRGERAELDAQLSAAVAQRDELLAGLAAEIKAQAASRAGVAAEIPADLLGLYEKQRARSSGVGAAMLRFGRCTGCQLQVTAEDLNRYLATPPDQVLRCEECDRILVRSEDSAA